MSDLDKLRETILEVIKGFEPVGHLDGTPEKKVIPAGYDLLKDERTEYGFYWEYEDMELCADKIMAAVEQAVQRREVESLLQLPKLYRNCGLTLKYTGAVWQAGYTNIHGCWTDIDGFGDTPQSAIDRLAEAAAGEPGAEGGDV